MKSISDIVKIKMKKNCSFLGPIFKSVLFPKLVLTVANRNWKTIPPEILANVPTLRELYLDGNQLENVEELATRIKKLHVLNLYGNHIREAPFANKEIHELYLGHNQLTTQGLSRLFPTKTRELFLSNNKITDEGLAEIAKGLRNNQTLQYLSLHHNEISNIQPLLDILPTTRITSLDLANNFLDVESIQALQRVPQLWDLDVEDQS